MSACKGTHKPNRSKQTSCFALWLVSLLPFFPAAHTLQNGVGQTPAMGWNSWNTFRCNINETLIKEVADAVVGSGLRDAGYVYINIDDCWMADRDSNGNLRPNAATFPSGMKALGNYIHSKGLKFGIYSDVGNKTCEGYVGSWGHETQDAKMFAEWGVDYLKFDYCGMDKASETAEQSYMRMSNALQATGRPILFSLCSWGAGDPWLWGSKVAHSWRVSPDVFATWDKASAAALKLPSFLISVTEAVEIAQKHAAYAVPGGFNDADMLVVGLDGMYPYGNVKECPPHVKDCKPGDYVSREKWGMVGGLSLVQQRTHFSLYCMLASPLILGNDPRHMSRATLEILTAKDVLAVHQDPLGKQAVRVLNNGPSGGIDVWVKPLTGQGRAAVLVVNHGNAVVDFDLSWEAQMPNISKSWVRDQPRPLQGNCEDKDPGCPNWAARGECERNPTYMKESCKKSCPGGCPQPPTPRPMALGLVRDAWGQEDLDIALDVYTVRKVDPHEGRLLVVQFMEPTEAAAWRTARATKPSYPVLSSPATAPAAAAAVAASPPVVKPEVPAAVPKSSPQESGARDAKPDPAGCSTWKALLATAEGEKKKLAQQVNSLTSSLASVRHQQQSQQEGQHHAGGAPGAAGLKGSLLKRVVSLGRDGASADGGAIVDGDGEHEVSPVTVALVVTNVFWVCVMTAVGCLLTVRQRRPRRKSDRYLY